MHYRNVEKYGVSNKIYRALEFTDSSCLPFVYPHGVSLSLNHQLLYTILTDCHAVIFQESFLT